VTEIPVILFVLGAPGVGKTTVARQLLCFDALPVQFTEPPAPKWSRCGSIVAAGYYKGDTFDGADTIPYSGAKAALEYWASHYRDEVALTILDGARFSTAPSLARIRELAPRHAIVGVHLTADAAVDARRRARGSDQDPAWLKGATTRARNFAEQLGAFNIDASGDPSSVFWAVCDVVLAAFQGRSAA
jgi:hypothetical protein